MLDAELFCPRSRIQLLAEHEAAEKLREQQQRQLAPSQHTGSSGPWILLRKGAIVERLPQYSPKATSYKVEGKPVIRYSG